ncbi:S-methyl-5'-thioadenosine phosphorylase [Candidatus Woesearchaeota archaeon]|nr:S-methyl-5'-thioadenosine phosphorylase [Candidatus Woesearchaeota archaeon]
MAKIGIIGGSGLDNPKMLSEYEEKKVTTPYGEPSSVLTCGKLNGVKVVILSRHGKKHTIPPTQVNYRANVWALKKEGCTHILATTACGSLREQIGRGDFVILDQFIDFTRHRKTSFHEDFEKGPKHTAMAEPFDKKLRKVLVDTAKELKYKVHGKGTLVTIEGPRFSTKAESHMFRAWGADVINMTVASEAVLANEMNIPYAAVAMSTDYDCWKEDEKPVTWQEILKVLLLNSRKVKKLLIKTVAKVK